MTSQPAGHRDLLLLPWLPTACGLRNGTRRPFLTQHVERVAGFTELLAVIAEHSDDGDGPIGGRGQDSDRDLGL